MSSLKVETMVCCFPEIHSMVYRALCDQASVFLSCLIWPHCASWFQLPHHTDIYSVPIHHVLAHFQPPHTVFPPACNALFYPLERCPWKLCSLSVPQLNVTSSKNLIWTSRPREVPLFYSSKTFCASSCTILHLLQSCDSYHLTQV